MKNSESNADCEEKCARVSGVPELGLARERRVSRPWEREIDKTRVAAHQRPIVERVPRRWDRFLRLMGEPAVRKLLSSHVAVFGLGGVGSYAVEALARSAVGHLTLVDFDDVCVTNVNRQLQAFPANVGQPKAALLAERAKAINPDAIVEPIQAFYSAETSDELLSPRPDFVVDAIDNVTAKLHLLETCLRLGIPVVSVSGSGARLDPTQVRVADLSQTKHDPLARVLRRQLASRGIDTSKHVGLPVVFSEEAIREPIAPTWDDEGFRCICPHAADSPHGCEKRRIIYGTASFVTAAFGMAAVSVAIRHLTADSIQADRQQISSDPCDPSREEDCDLS